MWDLGLVKFKWACHVLATFLVKGEKNAKEQVKSHLPKFGMKMCLWLISKQLWMARIRVPRSMVRIRFRSPLAFLPLSRGGVRNRAHTSLIAMIRAPRSTTHRKFWTPIAFLNLIRGRGGSGIKHASSQRSGSKRPDRRRIGDPTLLSRSSFNQCGAFPCHVTSRAASPLLPIFHFTS
jgi:hypothetical protein